ncbi:hypothetical protein HRbin02_01222 [Candidatus Calditenuaceae archaeon HR02]|nr:hypothetical protein HRbin02_01222 [Candidatus Calditenuaceae archaeon HR02]
MERHYLSYPVRVRMCRRVLELRGEGLSYGMILERLYEEFRVWINKSLISYWFRGIHTPRCRVNVIKKEDYWFGYVVGSVLSDGNRNRHTGNIGVEIYTKDREFTEMCTKALRRIGVSPSIRFKDGRYIVRAKSTELYYLLDSG